MFLHFQVVVLAAIKQWFFSSLTQILQWPEVLTSDTYLDFSISFLSCFSALSAHFRNTLSRRTERLRCLSGLCSLKQNSVSREVTADHRWGSSNYGTEIISACFWDCSPGTNRHHIYMLLYFKVYVPFQVKSQWLLLSILQHVRYKITWLVTYIPLQVEVPL